METTQLRREVALPNLVLWQWVIRPLKHAPMLPKARRPGRPRLRARGFTRTRAARECVRELATAEDAAKPLSVLDWPRLRQYREWQASQRAARPAAHPYRLEEVERTGGVGGESVPDTEPGTPPGVVAARRDLSGLSALVRGRRRRWASATSAQRPLRSQTKPTRLSEGSSHLVSDTRQRIPSTALAIVLVACSSASACGAGQSGRRCYVRRPCNDSRRRCT